MRIIAEDSLTRELVYELKKFASRRLRIYLWGESGVGKDTFALYYHSLCGCKGIFLKLGLHNISPTLAEAQFFGYSKGAFSDAFQAKEGFLDRVREGTLYLDMLDTLPIDLQAKFFDPLESGRYTPLGSTEIRQSRFVLVASGSLPLQDAVSSGKVYEKYLHLFHINLRIPPLRERKGDILPLIEHFSGGRFSQLDRKGLLSYPWPGNIRELKNYVEKEIALGKEELLAPEEEFWFPPSGEVLTLKQIQRLYAKKVLDMFRGNKTRAAKALGITRKTLRRLVEK